MTAQLIGHRSRKPLDPNRKSIADLVDWADAIQYIARTDAPTPGQLWERVVESAVANVRAHLVDGVHYYRAECKACAWSEAGVHRGDPYGAHRMAQIECDKHNTTKHVEEK